MYLKYGYADERLLTNEQILYLYFLKEEKKADGINVYNIKEWLTLIYEDIGNLLKTNLIKSIMKH